MGPLSARLRRGVRGGPDSDAAHSGTELGWFPENLGVVARIALIVLFAALCGTIAARAGDPAAAPAFIFQAALGLSLGVIDLRTRRLPDALTLPAYGVTALLLVAAAACTGQWRSLARAVICALVVYAIYFACSWWTEGRGVGFGDVKLAGLLAATLGWSGSDAVLLGLLCAHVLAALTIVLLIVLRQPWRGRSVAFGPYLVAGWFIGVVISS
jgi:leader peptidase (prepilin peptidase)/N-methyltransferase